MRLVVWRVKIHTIPTGREGDLGTDSAGAEVIGQVRRIIARAGSAAERLEVFTFEAAVADTAGFAFGATESRVASQHTEALG